MFIICQNEQQNKRQHGNRTFDCSCRGCWFHFYCRDIINFGGISMCNSPIPIKFKDIIEYVPAEAKRIHEDTNK